MNYDKAQEVLEAIAAFFAESDTIHAGALLFEGDQTLAEAVAEALSDPEPRRQVQTSGPQCKKCGGFTTYKRRDTHGMCMKCEGEAKLAVS